MASSSEVHGLFEWLGVLVIKHLHVLRHALGGVNHHVLLEVLIQLVGVEVSVVNLNVELEWIIMLALVLSLLLMFLHHLDLLWQGGAEVVHDVL